MSVVCRVSTGAPFHSAKFRPSWQVVSPCPRVSVAATWDRYTIIRNYFRRQISHPTTRLTPKQSTSPSHMLYTVRTIPLRHQCRQVPEMRSRLVHATSVRPMDEKSKLPQDGQAESQKAQEEFNSNLDNYSSFFRRLALSVPHLHRPTKDDLLNVTTGFWQRARVRFKWFTIKSFRRWNADDISAFFTWFLMTQTVWVLVGT